MYVFTFQHTQLYSVMFILFVSLVALFSYAECHVSNIGGVPTLTEDICTTSIPPFQSYHIHTLFWQNNANSTHMAEKLLDGFMNSFGLTMEENSCLVIY